MASNPPSDPEGIMPDNQEIRLHVDNQVFKVRKDVLCENSDYFHAMFNGNYAERTKQDIYIDVVEQSSMDTIIRYMNSGVLDLSQVPLAKIKSLAICADYLQMTKFMKQIEYWMDLRLSVSNWVEIMLISEMGSLTKLKILAASFGLLSFKEMKPEYIPNVERLYWYLSHPFLNTNCELDVFKFGYKWILGASSLNIDLISLILTCLDVTKVTIHDLNEMSLILAGCKNILATEVVSCLKMLLLNKEEINMKNVVAYKKEIEKHSELAYNEVCTVVKCSPRRTLMFTPVIPMWTIGGGKNEKVPQSLYKFSMEKGFERWLEISKEDLWGWSLVAWGPNKLVLVCGEHGKGTGQFKRDVVVYDTLRNEWTQHEVQLPPRRHAGVTITRDFLFIVGGIGGFRVTENSAHIYDLKMRKCRKICKFPDAIQSPAICTHYDSVYASGHNNIYKYGATDDWSIVLKTEMRINRMISFKEHIYCSQNYFNSLYRFRPNVDIRLETITQFKAPVAAFCNLGNQLVAFTSSACGQAEDLRVESYSGPCTCPVGTCKLGQGGCGPQVLWSNAAPHFAFNEVAGACAIVTTTPPIRFEMNEYHNNLISSYGNIEYKRPDTIVDDEKSGASLISEESVETTDNEGTDDADL